MADLIDRIAGTTDRPKIDLHRFVAAERLYAIGKVSRSEIAAEWDLQGDEVTQAVALADNIDAEVGVTARIEYVLLVESVCMCLEVTEDGFYHNQDGTINRAKVYEDIQIAG